MGTALPAEDGAYKMPISAGVTVERKLNDYLGIETGLLYSNLRSEGQHLHYLGIPLKANITLMDTKKIDLYATVGGVADKCIAGAPDNSLKKNLSNWQLLPVSESLTKLMTDWRFCRAGCFPSFQDGFETGYGTHETAD